MIFERDSRAARSGSGARLDQLPGVRVAELQLGRGQRVEQAGVVLAQHLTQPLQVPGPVPDQALMRARDQLQALDLGRVAGDRAVMVAVQTHDLGQHVGITRVGLRPRGGVPLPVAGHRHRVDREHLIPGRDQRGHPRAAVGLDPDHHPPRRQHPGLGIHRSSVVEVLGDHLVQPGHPGHALGQPRPAQPLPVAVEDLDVVVVLGPVVTDEQHRHCLLTVNSTVDGSAEQTTAT